MIHNLTLLYRAFGRYRRQIFLLGVLGAMSGVLASIGIGALIPIFSILVGEKSAVSEVFGRYFIAVFEYLGLTLTLRNLLWAIVAVFLIRAGTLFVFVYLRSKIKADYRNETIKDLFSKLLGARWRFLVRQKSGHLQTILAHDIQKCVGALEKLGQLLFAVTNIAAFAVFALFISWRTVLLALGAGGTILVVFWILIKRAKMLAGQMSVKEKDTAQFFFEHILGMRSVKSEVVEDRVAQKGRRLFSELRRISLWQDIYRKSLNISVEPLTVVFIVLLFAFSYRSSGFDFGAFVAVVILLQRLFLYLELGQMALQGIGENLPYVEAVETFRDRFSREQEDGGGRAFSFKKEIAFKGVSFAYAGSRVFSSLDFSVKRGEMIGLIGPSGSGKTTLADLVMRFIVPDKGGVFLDGVPAEEFSIRDWRKNIGYMPQDIFLLNDTIEANIKFYDEEIDEAKMVEAARRANIYEFIRGLDQGFGTVVGDRGIALSAGQRQRIVLARVLAREPQILILDEATSSLDNESDRLIKEAVRQFKGRVTVLIIAHRPATVTNADRLLVLDRGKIFEEGPPEKLLKDRFSYFYRIYNLNEIGGDGKT